MLIFCEFHIKWRRLHVVQASSSKASVPKPSLDPKPQDICKALIIPHHLNVVMPQAAWQLLKKENKEEDIQQRNQHKFITGG